MHVPPSSIEMWWKIDRLTVILLAFWITEIVVSSFPLLFRIFSSLDDKSHCRSCRLSMCYAVGMKKESESSVLTLLMSVPVILNNIERRKTSIAQKSVVKLEMKVEEDDMKQIVIFSTTQNEMNLFYSCRSCTIPTCLKLWSIGWFWIWGKLRTHSIRCGK